MKSLVLQDRISMVAIKLVKNYEISTIYDILQVYNEIDFIAFRFTRILKINYISSLHLKGLSSTNIKIELDSSFYKQERTGNIDKLWEKYYKARSK